MSDHPVCGTKVGLAKIFLMPQPPRLTRRDYARPKKSSRKTSKDDLCVSVSLWFLTPSGTRTYSQYDHYIEQIAEVNQCVIESGQNKVEGSG